MQINFMISFFVFSLSAFFLALLFCRNLPNSKFLTKSKEEKLEEITTETKGAPKRTPNKTLIHVVVITTLRPGNFAVLTQSVARMQSLMQRQDFFAVNLKICDVASRPHPEADRLARFFPVVKKPKESEFLNKFEREKRDYVFCLNLRNSGSDSPRASAFTLLLEDDAVAHEDLFPVLHDVIHIRFRRHPELAHALYFKLYHPERLLGYVNPEGARIVEGLLVAAVLGAILAAILKRVACFCSRFNFVTKCCYRRQSEKACHWSHSLSHWLISSLFVLMMMELIGRNNCLQLKRHHPKLYSVVPVPDCCTVALLFPQRRIPDVIKGLKRSSCRSGFAKDTALDAFRKQETNGGAYYVEPNLFKHIGYYTTLRKSSTMNPFVV